MISENSSWQFYSLHWYKVRNQYFLRIFRILCTLLQRTSQVVFYVSFKMIWTLITCYIKIYMGSRDYSYKREDANTMWFLYSIVSGIFSSMTIIIIIIIIIIIFCVVNGIKELSHCSPYMSQKATKMGTQCLGAAGPPSSRDSKHGIWSSRLGVGHGVDNLIP